MEVIRPTFGNARKRTKGCVLRVPFRSMGTETVDLPQNSSTWREKIVAVTRSAISFVNIYGFTMIKGTSPGEATSIYIPVL